MGCSRIALALFLLVPACASRPSYTPPAAVVIPAGTATATTNEARIIAAPPADEVSAPAAAAPAPVEAHFQGTIEVAVTTNAKRSTSTYWIKKTSVKIVSADKSGTDMLALGEERQIFLLDRSTQTAKNLPMGKTHAPPADVVSTGREDIVAGHPCVVHEKHVPAWTAEVCFAKDIFLPVSLDLDVFGVWSEGQGFPLRIIVKDKRGKEMTRSVATRVDARALPDNAFEIPKGFSKVDILGQKL